METSADPSKLTEKWVETRRSRVFFNRYSVQMFALKSIVCV